jgi:LysM repeat protein
VIGEKLRARRRARDHFCVRTPYVLVLVALGRPAEAGRHIVARGETLERVAAHYGCSTDAVLRTNGLTTTIVPPGTVVEIPSCPRAARAAGTIRTRAAVREPAIREPVVREPVADSSPERASGPQSVGQPWSGRLRGGVRLPPGEGYRVRRPERAFAARHVVEHLRGAIAAVRALRPHVHELAIGDLSAEGGGKLDEHRSHQSGLDVDLGFYFRAPPPGYPDAFAAANEDLDLAATWALIAAFARTSELPDGVQVIFLDRGVQARLYDWARGRGTPEPQLAELLQYPREPDVAEGLVRHWPHHADHLHVRFKP